MAQVPQTFQIGDRSNITMEQLLNIIERMYIDLATAVNSKPDLYQRTVNGMPENADPTNTSLAQGSININTKTNLVQMLTQHVSINPPLVTWTTLS